MKVEGKNPVKESLSSQKTIEKILILNGTTDQELRGFQKIAKDRGIKLEFVDKKVLDRISETGHHQGVIAVVSDFVYSDLDEVLKREKKSQSGRLFLVLDEILDPHNLGSIIRSAECEGADAVIIPNRRSASVNETVVRTSAGATAYVPVCKVSNINSAIQKLKENGVWVFALDMDGEVAYKANLSGDIALVVGGEGAGVHSLTKKLCDGVIKIPMFGKVNSLNASVSAGIALYEVIRQRGEKVE